MNNEYRIMSVDFRISISNFRFGFFDADLYGLTRLSSNEEWSLLNDKFSFSRILVPPAAQRAISIESYNLKTESKFPHPYGCGIYRDG